MFCKKGVLKKFVKFTGKHLCQSLFFNKVAGLTYMLLIFMSKKIKRLFMVNKSSHFLLKKCFLNILIQFLSTVKFIIYPSGATAVLLLYSGRKLNVHKTFTRCPGRILNVIYMFNLLPLSRVSFS